MDHASLLRVEVLLSPYYHDQMVPLRPLVLMYDAEASHLSLYI